jgi:translation initiation factor 1 (eIF-1/SUI1)
MATPTVDVAHVLEVQGPHGKVAIYSARASEPEKIVPMLPFRYKIVDDLTNVYSEIYVITDVETGKKYVGQSVSHRLNNGRYRPFGAEKRFKTHESQARCNSVGKPCQEVHLAIRRVIAAEGSLAELMPCEVIAICPTAEASAWEAHFIRELNALYPNGYNLTQGGFQVPTGGIIHLRRANPTEVADVEHIKRAIGNTVHSEDTRSKIAAGIRAFHDNSERAADMRENIAHTTREQHMKKKYDVGMQFLINASDFDSYLSTTKDGIKVIFERKREGKRVTFTKGKTETDEECKARAMAFLAELVRRQATNQTNQTN